MSRDALREAWGEWEWRRTPLVWEWSEPAVTFEDFKRALMTGMRPLGTTSMEIPGGYVHTWMPGRPTRRQRARGWLRRHLHL